MSELNINCNENSQETPNFQYYHDLIVSIIAALEARDSYTANHSKRVSDMAEKLCLYLNLDFNKMHEIHLAAHVHDIGKIGIPDSILMKNSKLSTEEWSIMKSHPEIGAKILQSSEKLNSISRIVLHHHERWDGYGYPLGLNGEDIPYGSRVIAICDSVDAMLSNRPYRPQMTNEFCKNEIIKGIGKIYDPAIAKIFLNNWNSLVNYNNEGGLKLCL